MGSESATGCQRWRSMNRGIAHRGQAASMMHQPRKGGRIGRASGSARGETRSPCRSQTARRALRRRPAEGSAASARSAAPWFATKAPAKTVCVSVCSPRQISKVFFDRKIWGGFQGCFHFPPGREKEHPPGWATRTTSPSRPLRRGRRCARTRTRRSVLTGALFPFRSFSVLSCRRLCTTSPFAIRCAETGGFPVFLDH